MVLVFKGRMQSGRKPTVGQVRRIVKGQINRAHETKVLGLGASSIAVSTTPGFLELSAMAQGITKATRIGDAIRLRSLNLRLVIQGADSTNLIRIMLVRGFRALTAADGPTAIAANFDRDDGLVLFDRLYGTEAVAGPNAFKENLHLFPKGDIRYDGAGTGSVRGGLYLFHVSDSVATAHPVLVMVGEMYYKDL